MLSYRALKSIVVALLAALSLTGATTMAVACSTPLARNCAQASSGCTDEEQVSGCTLICASACAAVEPYAPSPSSVLDQACTVDGETAVHSFGYQAKPEPPPPRA